MGIFKKYQDWNGRFEGVLNKKWQRIIDVQCLDSPYNAINDVKSCTAKLKPIWTAGSGFSSISPSNLDQRVQQLKILRFGGQTVLCT